MPSIKGDRYNKGFEKLSKKLRLMYNCAYCNSSDFNQLELHHIDNDKQNDTISNLIVLCKKHHNDLHNEKIKINLESLNYKISGISVTVARFASSKEDWFDSKLPLKILPQYPPEKANQFRRQNIKGFIRPGSCNFYIALHHNNRIIGVLGFSIPDWGSYDLLLKADTTPQKYINSIDLLLYVLKTNTVKKILEDKFNREIKTVYSMVFTKNRVVSRYRKHAKKIQEKKIEGGYNLGYLFEMGTFNTLKQVKSLFIQKHYNENKKQNNN
jgi:hypothetical protein